MVTKKTTGAGPTGLGAGLAALEAGEWGKARDALTSALAQEETPETLEALAELGWWTGDEKLVFEARERAYHLYRERGDRQGAARMAIWLGNDSLEFRGQVAVSRGWFQRARRLLEGLGATPEQGWLTLWLAHTALMVNNDANTARKLAAEAVSLGNQLKSADIEMTALAVQGLATVCRGQIDEGLKLLDEAATAVIAGEMTDRNGMGTVICYMMDACDRIRDFDRAAQWCARARELGELWHWEVLLAVCRPHYAVVLTWRGEWQEAEQQLEASNRETMEFRPPMATEGIVRLAELRWRQGRWDEAEALFEKVKHEGLSQLGRAELALSRGDTATAIDVAERYLRRIPKPDRIERAPGLDLMIRALAMAGGSAEAEEWVRELRGIGKRMGTDPLLGSANLAAGVLAASKGDTAEARRHLEDAVDCFERSQAPFESGRARIELARALAAEGRPAEAERVAMEALQVLQRVGAAKEAERAAAMIRDLGGRRAAIAQDDARLTQREREVLELIARGRSNLEIAEGLVLSVRTVERHISTIYEKIGVSGRSARAAATAYALKRNIA